MSIRRTMTMTWRVLLTLSLVGQTLCATSQAVADDQLVERAAATVVDATVLVRMCCPPAQTVAKPANGPNAKLQISISVCSGVSLGNGLIVTSLRPVPSARFRITLPGGDRIDAVTRVQARLLGGARRLRQHDGAPCREHCRSPRADCLGVARGFLQFWQMPTLRPL